MQIPQEECLTRVGGGAKFCYMSGAAITSTNRSCSGPCRRPSTGRGRTMIYAHVLDRGWAAVRSPADCLLSKEAGSEPYRRITAWA